MMDPRPIPSPASLQVNDRQALEAFVVENADLETLEAHLEQFNIFEALGVVRQELRHSDFLAFLLDPRQNHRLGDLFLRRLLQKILISAGPRQSAISPVHVDSWDLSQLSVHREWKNIDILLIDPLNHQVIIVENKISSTEHSNQLERYLRIVDAEFAPSEWTRLAIYLTPDGEDASTPEYLSADYRMVADAVEALSKSRRASLDLAMSELMVHYAHMLRRHIVTDSEIADLCRRIYQRHQRALDLLFEHRPDLLAEVQALLVELVNSHEELILDSASKQLVRFVPVAWEKLPKGSGWTRSGRIILFEFSIYPDRLDLTLWVGPGPENYRERFIELASALQPPFRLRKGSQGKYHKSIFGRAFLRPTDFVDAAPGAIEQLVRLRWDEFITRDLPQLVPPLQESGESWEARDTNVTI